MSENSGEIPALPGVEISPVAAVEAPAETTPSDELGPEVIQFAEAVGKLREKGREIGDDHFQSIQEAANLVIPEPAAQTFENDGAVPYVDPEDPDAEPFAYMNQTEQPATEATQESEEPDADSDETAESPVENEEDSDEEEDGDDESDGSAEEDETAEDDEDKESDEKEGLTEAEMREIAETIMRLQAEKTKLQIEVGTLRNQSITDEIKSQISEHESRIAEIADQIAIEEGKLKVESNSGSNKALFAGLILAGIAAMVVTQAMRADAA